MDRRLLFRGLCASGLVGLGWTLAISEPPGDQDPWTKAPPLPTACYSESDPATEKLSAAVEVIQTDMARQQRINDELSDRLKTLDPMEQASKLQEYLMAHPEDGTKLMQQNAALGETYSATLLQSVEDTKKLEAELAGMLARYKAAVDGAQAPIEAKFKDLDVRAQKDLVVVGEGYAYAPWAVKEYNALRAQSNKSYESLCASWWNTTGPFHGWMKKYKDHLIKDEIPTREEADRVGVGFMIVLVGTPEKPYRSTATHQATLDYLNRAVNLFTERWMRPGRNY